jgi:hypothetical protein
MESNSHPIIYTSAPASVSMTDHWYEAAHPEHFWIRRRFDVMDRLAGSLIRNAHSIGEIGCGNGLVQKSIEDHYGKAVAGFDLNEHALKQNLSRLSPCYCYDVHQRAEEFRAKFDVLLLFDVLEHIEDESAFLQSVKFHISRSGVLIVNVPALQALYSKYDKAAGHYRRYRASGLSEVLAKNGLAVRAATYWGAPLTPVLAVRKAMLAMRRDEANIISSGFDPGPAVVNGALGLLARCEPIPQMWLGSSLMVVAEMT